MKLWEERQKTRNIASALLIGGLFVFPGSKTRSRFKLYILFLSKVRINGIKFKLQVDFFLKMPVKYNTLSNI